MRKKALLVGALPPFEGPSVSLEVGEWLVGPPSSGRAEFCINGGLYCLLDREIIIHGPAKIRAKVIEGEIYLNIVQIKRAS